MKNRRDQAHNEAWREGRARRKGPGQCHPAALHAGGPVTTGSVHRGTRGGLAVWLAAGVTYVVGRVAAPCSGILTVITTAAAVNAVAASADALASVIIVVSFAPPAAARAAPAMS